jgi:hypothetical protein
MKRTHAFIISLALAVAVVAGSFAALRSQHLAQQASGARVGAAQFDRQMRALDRAEARLSAELRRRPPAIPALSTVAPATTRNQPQAIIYRRPAPIVHVIHRHGGEHESEHEARGDGGGGSDD